MNGGPATEARLSAAGFSPGVPGITPPSNPDRHGDFLTDVITELGFADRETVEKAVEETRQTAGTPESRLLETGAIDHRQLSLAVAERNGIDHVDLDRFDPDPEAVAMIDKSTAARYTALPIAFATDRALLIAIDDPTHTLGISDIEVMTRSEVRPVIAAGTQISHLIDELPEDAFSPAPESAPLPLEPTPDRPPAQPAPPAAAAPDSVWEHDIPEASEGAGAGKSEAGLGDPAAALQETLRQAGTLVEVVERAWRRSANRERELEKQLNEAQERIAALKRVQSKTATAAELAGAASERLVELRELLGDGG
jgi:hypothetical protein